MMTKIAFVKYCRDRAIPYEDAVYARSALNNLFALINSGSYVPEITEEEFKKYSRKLAELEEGMR